jgi:hypothetical protein
VGCLGGIGPHATPDSGIVDDVSNVAHRDENCELTFVDAADALRLARPLPSADELAIDGLTDDEWDAFMRALANR